MARSHRYSRIALWGVLLAVLLRAYVPAGFMPAAGQPGLLALCPVGLPMALTGHLHHHHHSDGNGPAPSGFESCPFGSAPAAAPLPSLAAFAPPEPYERATLPVALPLIIGVRATRAHRARAPPLTTPC